MKHQIKVMKIVKIQVILTSQNLTMSLRIIRQTIQDPVVKFADHRDMMTLSWKTNLYVWCEIVTHFIRGSDSVIVR